MELDTAIKGIISVRERIASSWDNPVELSDLGNKMATYNAHLGDHLGQLEEEREVNKGKAYLQCLKNGMSATASDNHSRAQTSETYGQIKRLKLMHSDADTQVSMIQSRLKVLENQLRGSY